MLKIRITYADENEKDIALKKLEDNFKVLNISKIYKGRGTSIYNNIYIDLENK